MIHPILVLGFSWADYFQCGYWLTGRKIAPLCRSLAFRPNKDNGFVSRASRRNVEEFILLFKYQIGLSASQGVTKELVRSLSHGVFGGKKDRLIVGRPGYVSDALKRFRQQLSRPQVFNLEFVLPVAGGVGGIGEQVAVITRNISADAKKLQTFRKFILIQNDLFLCLEVVFLAAVDRILFALLRARVIKITSPTIRHSVVGLLDVADHLFVELVLQGNGGFHHHFCVRILGFQMCDDLRICFLSQPEIVVDHRIVMNFCGLGFLFSHGWLKRIVGIRLCKAGSVKRQTN